MGKSNGNVGKGKYKNIKPLIPTKAELLKLAEQKANTERNTGIQNITIKDTV